jgi:hypothetical protein
MAVNVQKPHQMSALTDAETREFRPQLFRSMVCRQAGEPPPQCLHFRPTVPLPLRSRDTGERKLRARDGLRSSDQLADRILSHPKAGRDRSIA